MADHPIRIAAATESGVVKDTLLEQMVKRYALCLGPTESLGDVDQGTGQIALAVIHAATGYIYFYDDSDTTTLDDGLFTLVDGSGHRYHIQDAASLSLNSVLSRTNTPPGSPTVGDVYIVGTAPTGAWAANANDIAVYTARGWIYASPTIGFTVYNQDTSSSWLYDETPQWVDFNPLAVASGDAIIDDAGKKILEFLKAGTAVNWAAVGNAATGNGVEIQAKGGDTNVDLILTPKGTGNVKLDGFTFPNSDGTSGQALVTNGSKVISWGSAGGKKFLAKLTASSSSQLDFTGFANSIYESYEFDFANLVPASDANFQIYFSSNGGSSFSSSSYRRVASVVKNASAAGHTSGNSVLTASEDVTSSDSRGLSGSLKLYGSGNAGVYTSFEFKTVFKNDVSDYYVVSGGGWRESNSITDAVRFFFDSTNIASGTITMFGHRNS